MDKAKSLLLANSYTCVLRKGDKVYTSRQRGVLPLVSYLDSGEDFTGFSAADKVVGKGAAFLYCLLGVKEVWASVISQPALEVLQTHHIRVQYEVLVPAIYNRAGTGLCPMEAATGEETDPAAALIKIRSTLKMLQNG